MNCKRCGKKIVRKSHNQKYCGTCRKKAYSKQRRKYKKSQKGKLTSLKYYQKNKEKIRKYQERWEKKNPNYYKEYNQRPEVKKRSRIYSKKHYQKNKKKIQEYSKMKIKLWKSLSDKEQLRLINKKSKEILKNLK